MKCVMCDREMDKVAHWVAGHPVGPKCYQKRFGNPIRVDVKIVANDQPDLFLEDHDLLPPVIAKAIERE